MSSTSSTPYWNEKVAVAQSIRDHLHARREEILADESQLDPEYAVEVLIYVERIIMEQYMPNEKPPVNSVEIYLGSAITCLNTLLPKDASELEFLFAGIFRRQIELNWYADYRREKDLMELEKMFEDLENESENEMEEKKDDGKPLEPPKPHPEFDELSQRFEGIKRAAIWTSRIRNHMN